MQQVLSQAVSTNTTLLLTSSMAVWQSGDAILGGMHHAASLADPQVLFLPCESWRLLFQVRLGTRGGHTSVAQSLLSQPCLYHVPAPSDSVLWG